MEKKKESTASNPLDMCAKLFNAFKPAFRPFRRLTFHHQEPGGTTNPSSTRPNHSLDSRSKDPSPQNELPTSVKKIPLELEKKPAEAIAPKVEPHHTSPKPAATPPQPPPASVQVWKVPDKVVPSMAPPKAVTIPQPTAPKAAATPQPLPQPVPPASAAAETESSKKNINERVEDYIKRAKAKMRTGSGVGPAQ